MIALSTAFPRARRLTSGVDYSRVFRGASRSSDRFFTVLATRNDLPSARLGLAISRKVAPRAVDRNRLRRIARESFRQLDLMPLDYVVMAKKDTVEAPNSVVRSSLDQHFTRLSERASTDN